MNKEFQFKPKMERTPWLTPPEESWKNVLEKLAPLPMEKGVYVTYEGIPEMWKK